MDEDDPLRLKILEENEDPQTTQNTGVQMKNGEDREAKNMIDHFIEILKDKHITINCEEVIKEAEKDEDLKRSPKI